MKTAFVIRGKGNTGKSTTIWIIYERLLKKYPDAVFVGTNGANIRGILTIKKVKIGIEGQGDTVKVLLASLREFARKKCLVIICTDRTTRRKVDVDAEIRRLRYAVVVTPHHYFAEKEIGEQDDRNSRTAKKIAAQVIAAVGP